MFISLLEIFETDWVLESFYNISRYEILDSIEKLLLLPIFKFENPDLVKDFIYNVRNTSNDLSDFLIGHSTIFPGCSSVITFDKKASKSDLFELCA